MKPIEIISQDVFDKIRSRFQNLEMGDETGAVTIDPGKARFFDFDFVVEGNDLGRVSISLNDLGSLKIYYSQGITENQDDVAKQLWYKFLKEMRMFAMRRLLRFDTRDITKTNLDKNDFQYLANKGAQKDEKMTQMYESRWNHRRSKKTSRAVSGRTQVIVRHKKAIEDRYPGERSQRKNIEAIYIESSRGERFLYPFNDPAGAFALAQHVEHGGIPHDPAGKAIMRMSEEMAQLQEFGRHIQRSQLHDDAMQITERAHNRLMELKKTIRALGKKHYYENWIANFKEEEMPSDDLDSLDAVTLEDYKTKFTQSNFQEELAKFFPLLHKIMSEENSIDLDEYVKESTEDNQMELNGKLIDPGSLEVDGIDRRDHPDYADAYFSNATYADGTPLSDEELDQLTDMYGDVVNQMAYDKMYEDKGNDFTQFEQWAEAVEKGDISQDQKANLKQAISDLKVPLDLDTAYNFFNEFGIQSDSLEQKFDAAKEFPDMDPMEVFKAWAKEEGKEELLNYLGINDAAAQTVSVPAEPSPSEPAASEPVPAAQPATENEDLKGIDPGVMESMKKNNLVKEVAKIVNQFYNRDHKEQGLGPFPKGQEGIALEVEKRISEMFGEQAGKHASTLAEKFMQKIIDREKPVEDDGLSRLKELTGIIKKKVETMGGDIGDGSKTFTNIMPAYEGSEMDQIKKLAGLVK